MTSPIVKGAEYKSIPQGQHPEEQKSRMHHYGAIDKGGIKEIPAKKPSAIQRLWKKIWGSQ